MLTLIPFSYLKKDIISIDEESSNEQKELEQTINLFG